MKRIDGWKKMCFSNESTGVLRLSQKDFFKDVTGCDSMVYTVLLDL